MAIADERLVLEASVVDDFTDTLLDLSEGLAEIDRLAASTVENIEADIEMSEFRRKAAEIESTLSEIDDDVDIGAGVGGPSAGGAVADGPSPEASADGGGPDTSLLDPDQIQRVSDEFGKAFTPDALFEDGAGRRAADFLDGDISEFLDIDKATELVLEGDLDPELITDFEGLDVDESLDALSELQELGVTSLPTDLSDQFRNLELKMGDFFRIFAALIPLIAIFVGAIPAAVSGLVALGGAALAAAGALAGVAGLAVLGAALDAEGNVETEQLTNRIEELFDQATAELGPVVQQYAPLLNDAFRTVEATIAGIADEAGVFRRVVGDARGALQYLETTVPSALRDIVRFGDAAMPILSGIIREMGNMGILRAFADLLVRTIPLLSTLTAEIVGMIPAVIQLSEGFLITATGLTMLLGVFFDIINVVPYAGQFIGVLTSLLLGLVSVTALYTVATSGATAAVLSFGKSILAAAGALIGKYTVGLLAATYGQYGFAAAAAVAAAQAAVLLGVLTFGLAPVLGTLSSGFTDLSGDIDSATESLRAFTNQAGNVGGSVGVDTTTPSGMSSTGGYADASSMTVVAPDKQTGTAIANTLSFGQPSVNDDVANRIHNQ
ncbi:hypothetical protein EXE44_04985 [Halorubrum sp. SS7]|uniref:hypothetical protein n=2 Tax=unclassified Halorubrum TaxID=2642239 RepID=UPI0010F946BD|nr:hypothetical protein [Halorubrum sp. SS7]TKX58902.1 hypothetical protein EXE44_04985 [Halorubrum sp. SS7]